MSFKCTPATAHHTAAFSVVAVDSQALLLFSSSNISIFVFTLVWVVTCDICLVTACL